MKKVAVPLPQAAMKGLKEMALAVLGSILAAVEKGIFRLQGSNQVRGDDTLHNQAKRCSSTHRKPCWPLRYPWP
jgi:hypothetical protein